jgi:hypothetical protein
MRRNDFEGKGRARRPINGRRGRYEKGNGKERKPIHLLVGRRAGQGELTGDALVPPNVHLFHQWKRAQAA